MAQVSGTRRGAHLRPRSSRKIGFAVGLLIAVVGGLFVSFATSAGAATEATVPAITSFADYPQDGLIPADCHEDGANVLVGVTYTITHAGVPRTVTVLDAEQLFIGDTVTMSWTDYAPGCEGIGVSLAVKSTDHNVFVITDNQALVSYQYCSGSDCGGNGQGFGNLTIQVPSKQDACNFQFDAVIGPPLSVVGPNGSYYSSSLRGDMNKAHPTDRDMLIGFSNGGKGECVAPTASAVQSCSTASGPGVDVAIVNPDTNDDATVDVLKNGITSSAGVIVPVGQTVHVIVPFGVNETGTVSVNWTDSAGPINPVKQIFSQQFTFDCLTTTTTTSTTSTTSTSSTTSTTSSSTTTTAPCTTVPGGTLPAECTTTTLPDTSTSVPDTVAGEEITRGTTLPRTGSSSTLPMTTLAGLLLMSGGLLLAAANRPMPATASTTSRRSRGR